MKPIKRILFILLTILLIPFIWFEAVIRAFIALAQWIWIGDISIMDDFFIFDLLNKIDPEEYES